MSDTDEELVLKSQIPYRVWSFLILLSLVSMLVFVLVFSGVVKIPRTATEGLVVFFLALMVLMMVFLAAVLLKPGKEVYRFEEGRRMIVHQGKKSPAEEIPFRGIKDVGIDIPEVKDQTVSIRVFGKGSPVTHERRLENRISVVMNLTGDRTLKFACGIDTELAAILNARFESFKKK